MLPFWNQQWISPCSFPTTLEQSARQKWEVALSVSTIMQNTPTMEVSQSKIPAVQLHTDMFGFRQATEDIV
jgi:hypothetical protein